MKRLIYLLPVSVIIAALLCPSVRANEAKERRAMRIANNWLVLVDEGRYVDSWQEAASYFQAAVDSQQWQMSMAAFRDPLGSVISREVASKHYTTRLPGAPDGEYVVIQYKTSFENKRVAIETVTPMRDKDGKWKVSGYYIR